MIAVLLAVIVVAYFPDQEQLASTNQSPPSAWSTDPIFVKAILGTFASGVLLILERIWRAIRTTSPQPGWQLFPSLWSKDRKREAAILSAGATLLGLGLWAVAIIASSIALTPQWVVGCVALITVGITTWGPIVVGLHYYEDLRKAERAELALELKEHAAGLEEALRTAVTQFETVRTELEKLKSETDRSRQAAAASRELAAAQRTIERHGRWRARREQIVFVIIGLVLGVVASVMLNVNGLREHLPDWMILFG